MFLGSIFVYGLFIYQGIIERAVTLLVGSAAVAVTIEMLRRGAQKKRTVVELRADYSHGGRHLFHVVSGVKPSVTPVLLEYTDCVEQATESGRLLPALSSLCSATFRSSPGGATEVKVWTHSSCTGRSRMAWRCRSRVAARHD